MSAITQSVADVLSLLGIGIIDNQSGAAAASSNLTATATRLNQANRFTLTPATSVAVLPSLLTGEAGLPVWVINEGASALTVYAYNDTLGHPEKLNGTASTFGGATGGQSVAAGAVGLFWPEDTPRGRGGGATASQLNWSAAVLT